MPDPTPIKRLEQRDQSGIHTSHDDQLDAIKKSLRADSDSLDATEKDYIKTGNKKSAETHDRIADRYAINLARKDSAVAVNYLKDLRNSKSPAEKAGGELTPILPKKKGGK